MPYDSLCEDDIRFPPLFEYDFSLDYLLPDPPLCRGILTLVPGP